MNYIDTLGNLQLGNFEFDAKLIGRIIVIMAIILIIYLIIMGFKKYFSILAKKNSSDAGSYKSIYLLVRYFFITIGSILVLQGMGVQISVLLASMTALLVGVGLGVQQLFMDLSSGIILLFERNLKINDVVELENDLIGKVIKINLRTSTIKTRDDIYIIVPNSKMVNDKIINWSLNDFNTRFFVEVGVSYNSDPREVEKVLLEALHRVDGIDDSMDPFVMFKDYGDSALIFRVYFYSINSFRIERLKSNLRFQISDSFREHGITVPFPQMDVHIKREAESPTQS